MIIDCHTHLASSQVIPAPFIRGMSENIYAGTAAASYPAPLNSIDTALRGMMSFDDSGDRLVAEMDQAGIDRSVLLIVDFGICFPDAFPDLEAVYTLHHNVMQRHPGRFEVFAGIDPRRENGIGLFEKSVKEWGFSGLKLYPPCGYSPSDTRLFPYYEICRQQGIPVLLHTGPTSPRLSFTYASPDWIEEAAFQFPDVRFILAHGAFMMQDQAALLAEYRPNIYLDVSGFTNALRMEKFETILTGHKKRGILHKLLFGTDWPIHKLSGNQATLIRLFTAAAEGILTAKELDMIFQENYMSIQKR